MNPYKYYYKEDMAYDFLFYPLELERLCVHSANKLAPNKRRGMTDPRMLNLFPKPSHQISHFWQK